MKAACAERVIRTIKERLFRFFRSTGTYAYLLLPRLVADYNNRVHRITKMKPKDVSAENEVVLFNRLNAKKKSARKFKYKVGDQVRVLLNRSMFTKSFTGLWRPHEYTVSRIKNSVPPVAYVRDLDGKELEGAWYASELQKVVKASDDKWPVVKVLRKKRIDGVLHCLVHWFGYDKSHDSWNKASDVARL